MNDRKYMELALSLAQSTVGQTSPNPAVGAVIVNDGEVVGTGAHLRAGMPHAEVHAITVARSLAEGATMYVTLEPCSHQGKTPPCANLIIESGIKKVMIASQDPNPLVAGKGVERLREAGIEVDVGLCEAEALQLNEMFFHYIQTKTPYVTLKVAVSLDGKTAAKTGDSAWITSSKSREDVHNLRHEHDSILVGINTILKDDPLLTTRRPQGGRNPIRIVLDTHLKIPITANVLKPSAKTIIFTGNKVDPNKKSEIQRFGVEIISLPTTHISVKDVLRELGERNIMSVFVEGGSEVHASFIEHDAFQQIITYVAPTIIGGRDAYPFDGGIGPELIKDGTALRFTTIEQIGPDLKITAKPNEKDDGDSCSQE